MEKIKKSNSSLDKSLFGYSSLSSVDIQQIHFLLIYQGLQKGKEIFLKEY